MQVSKSYRFFHCGRFEINREKTVSLNNRHKVEYLCKICSRIRFHGLLVGRRKKRIKYILFAKHTCLLSTRGYVLLEVVFQFWVSTHEEILLESYNKKTLNWKQERERNPVGRVIYDFGVWKNFKRITQKLFKSVSGHTCSNECFQPNTFADRSTCRFKFE